MKIAASLFWFVFIAACLGLIPEPFGLSINIAGMLLFIAHLVEFLVFKKVIMKQGDTAPKAFLMTMLFGVLYFRFNR